MTAAIGVQYFKQVFITWSIRSRGSVQRTHIMTRHAHAALEHEVEHAEQIADVMQQPAGRCAVMVPAEPMDDRHRPVPAAEEQDRRQPADGEHRAVLGHEEEAPPQAGVFGVKAGDQFALGLGQIERRAIDARRRAGEIDPEDDERERIVEARTNS